jgi:hypothetical protein
MKLSIKNRPSSVNINLTNWVRLFLLLVLAFSYSCTYGYGYGHVDTGKVTAPILKCNIQAYKNKVFIFDGDTKIVECDAFGIPIDIKRITTAPKGSVFTVTHVDGDNCNLVITFRGKFIDSEKQVKLNYKIIYNDSKALTDFDLNKDENIRKFLLSKDEFTNSTSEYTGSGKFDITFGSFVIPFKFRPTKSLFTSNLNLGGAAYFNYKLNTNNSIGAVTGISLSSVTLDSLSTDYKVKTSSERPALTPSLSVVYSHKNVNFSVGMGWDFINKTSVIENSWIFNGKKWVGFGIGINLFTANTGSANTTKTDQQK